MDLKKQRIEIAVTALIMALAGYLQYSAYHTKQRTNVQGMQSMTFPKIVLFLILGMCAIVLVQGILNYRRLKAKQNKEQAVQSAAGSANGGTMKIVLTTIMIVAYACMWKVIGFTLSSIVFVFAESMLLDRETSPAKALLIAAVYTAVVFVVFGVCFGVSFPEPIFEALMG